VRTATTRIPLGFIGLGHMGGNMAARLLAAGYVVHCTARTRARARWLLDRGVRWRDTPREVAEAAAVVFTSLPDDATLDAVAGGPDGILAALGPHQVWVDTSTVGPRTSRRLTARVRARGAAIGLALAAGRDLGVPLPSAAVAGTVLTAAGALGYDIAALVQVLGLQQQRTRRPGATEPPGT
jgi:3-hydroxyisobutyrate dehydrogenase-like beta-hydroxyacid dehydrogenase